MANQQKIIPLGRLPKAMVDIAGVRVLANFEVIEIMEDADPYPVLLGLDWAIDMGGVINLKKHSMVFGRKGTCVIVPLDPTEGVWYTKPAYEEEELDHIYKLTVQDEDQVNPTDEGMLYWEKDSECFSNSYEELENWQANCTKFRCSDVFRPSEIFGASLPWKGTCPTRRSQMIIRRRLNLRFPQNTGSRHYH